MVAITFNGDAQHVASIEDLSAALDIFDREPKFELWASVPEGPAMCMLRDGEHAWLMYLRFSGDTGFKSLGDPAQSDRGSYTLGNGQIDECPLSWCIGVEQCYKAMAYFFVNDGAKPDWIVWNET